MSQWYFAQDGQQRGPMDHAEAQAFIARNPNCFGWRDGMADWRRAAEIAELHGPAEQLAAPSVPPAMTGRMHGRSDVVDYKIFGQEMQFVEVELDPGESAIAEAGAMMYKAQSITMNTIFGDGRHGEEQSGVMDKLLGAGKRVLTGESLFTTMFTHEGTGKAHVAFGAPYPGSLLAIDLDEVGGTLICQKDSFLAAARGVQIGIHLQRKILTGLFGGEGFIMQRLEGDGMAFIHMGGCVVQRDLKPGEVLHVDTGCVAAMTADVDMDIERAGGIKTMLFGGEGLFFARLTGPGKVWLQSLPFSRLAGRMLQAAPQHGGKHVGEGSVLGGLGNLLDGDGF